MAPKQSPPAGSRPKIAVAPAPEIEALAKQPTAPLRGIMLGMFNLLLVVELALNIAFGIVNGEAIRNSSTMGAVIIGLKECLILALTYGSIVVLARAHRQLVRILNSD